MIIVFTGDGKGKTSAALGIALRASGYKMDTLIIQFMKKQGGSGEHRIQTPLSEHIEVHAFGGDFLFNGDDRAGHIKLAEEAWAFMERRLNERSFYMLILDELTLALKYGLLTIERVLDFLKAKPHNLHVIITGRDAQKRLMDIADIVTEMRKIRHAYDIGMPAMQGIDF
ncbi:MAG: cob(I)yrinic acid a,c-diamide adenosyltransferase [Syntrophorhabdales bacterium]|nr:cob(I)yrinic acid a,c-diamide adenosyltransferase [Syntrophorhabdales bacterium]